MSHAPFSPSSRSLLTPRDLPRFAGTTLFDAIARAVCGADCLPRKELYESWEVARRVRRKLRGGRVVELASGHSLIAHLLLILDDSSPNAIGVDVRIPASAERVSRALTDAWPRLRGRVALQKGTIDAVSLDSSDLVVAAHACGALTDQVLDASISARARVAVLPCCHNTATCDTGGLDGWMDMALAIDATRSARLRAAGYEVTAQKIPASVTPKNRLLIGLPRPSIGLS